MTRLSAVVMLLAFGGVASADPPYDRAIDTETFHPAIDSYGIFTVERAETGKQWDFGFKLFVDYGHQPLRFDLKDPASGMPARTNIMDFEVVMHLGAHLSLADWAEIAVQIPLSAQQFTAAYGSVDDPLHPTGFYTARGPTNIPPPDVTPLDTRVALKLRTPRMGPLGLALILAGTLPFGDEQAFLGDPTFSFRPTGVADVTFGKFTAAVNAGYILRPRRTYVLDPLDVANGVAKPATLIDQGQELTWSVGLAYRIISVVGVGAEAYGLIPLGTVQNPGPRLATTADNVVDVLGGLHFFPGRDVTIAVGAGASVLDSRRHDLFRVFAGLSWAPVEGGRTAGSFGGGIDSDGDGIPDGVDLCPKEPEDRDGFDDEDGCPDPDNDQDGIPDDQDKCPNEPEDKDGFQDDDGCPELDNDGDGIPDTQDKCPNEPEDKDGFQDDDGCPDLDNDGDGIPDDKDRCPNEPETKNGVDDDDGCPDTGGAVAISGGKLEIPEQIVFETGKARILPRSYALIDRIAQKLKDNPSVKRVRVEGHTDDQGGEKKNQELSQSRADAVIEFLIKRGVDPSRLQGAGYGATRPIASNKTAEGRAKNRRVEFIIVEQ